MSSLETVAAPCRAKAASASLLPAPMPPVMATATGRGTELRGRGRLLGRRRRTAFGIAWPRRLGRELLLHLGLARGLLVDDRVSALRHLAALTGRLQGCVWPLREDLLGKIEVRSGVHGLGLCGARAHVLAVLHPLQ